MKQIAALAAILLIAATLLAACSDPVSPDNGRTRKGGPNRSGITWQ